MPILSIRITNDRFALALTRGTPIISILFLHRLLTLSSNRTKLIELHAQNANMDAQGASQDQAIELASDSSSSSDAEPVRTIQSPSPPSSTHDIRNGVLSAMSLLDLGEALQPESVRKRGIAVVVHPVERAWEYRLYGGPAVSEIVERYDDGGFIEYLVRYDDESEDVVSCGSYMLP